MKTTLGEWATEVAAIKAWNNAPRKEENNGWISVNDKLPPDDTPVLAAAHGFNHPLVLEVRTETPSYYDSFKAFRYWDDPVNDGKDFEGRVFAWRSLPNMPVIK